MEAMDLGPEMLAWREAWARGETVRQPEWAGGREVLSWPRDASRRLPAEWARERSLLGATTDEVVERVGAPLDTLWNDSVSGVALVYGGFLVVLYDGMCTAWTPRSEGFESYFVQPDL